MKKSHTSCLRIKSLIRNYQATQRTWFPKGKQRKIPTYGKHHGAKLIGCLNYETGEMLCQVKEAYDAVAFQEFLLYILRQYPKTRVVMVLDNARIHHAKLIQPLLEQHRKRLELVFLSPYSPELPPLD